MISFELTALGFAIAWPMDSTQAFHAIVNLLLIPLWLLSGSLFPASGASGWLRFCMLLNPLTYGVEALRSCLFPMPRRSFRSGKPCGDRRFLRADLCGVVAHRQPAHEPPVGLGVMTSVRGGNQPAPFRRSAGSN